MKTSNRGVLEIAEHEGVVLGPYKDSVGVWTYGIGHTAAAGGLNPERMDRVDTRKWDEARVAQEILSILEVFSNDLDKYERRVSSAVKVSLLPHQFDSLVSFDFNTGGIHRADLTKQLNSGNMSGNGFMGWVRPKEIIKRRKAEQNLFKTGNYSANGNSIPVYDSLGNGSYRFRMSVDSQTLFDKYGKQGSGVGRPIKKVMPGPGIAAWGVGFILTAIATLIAKLTGGM